jgi:hypothetical protein
MRCCDLEIVIADSGVSILTIPEAERCDFLPAAAKREERSQGLSRWASPYAHNLHNNVHKLLRLVNVDFWL